MAKKIHLVWNWGQSTGQISHDIHYSIHVFDVDLSSPLPFCGNPSEDCIEKCQVALPHVVLSALHFRECQFLSKTSKHVGWCFLLCLGALINHKNFQSRGKSEKRDFFVKWNIVLKRWMEKKNYGCKKRILCHKKRLSLLDIIIFV